MATRGDRSRKAVRSTKRSARKAVGSAKPKARKAAGSQKSRARGTAVAGSEKSSAARKASGSGRPGAVGKDAEQLVERINGWAYCDIPRDPAQVAKTKAERLPKTFPAVLKLVSGPHHELISQLNSGQMSRFTETDGFDPTEFCEYHGTDAGVRRLAKRYFAGKTVEIAQGQGANNRPEEYDFVFDWLVVLEPQAGLIFTFVFNLQD
jgi:hypothetical protein